MFGRLFIFFILLLFVLFSGIYLGIPDVRSWYYGMPDGLFAFFMLLPFAGIFLGIPGLISWFCLSLQGWILRRRGRRNASKIVRTIEVVCIFACSFVVLTIVGRSFMHTIHVAV